MLRNLNSTILLAWNYSLLYVTQINPIEANAYLESVLLILSIIATIFHIFKSVKIIKEKKNGL
jgi:hypothetical protein